MDKEILEIVDILVVIRWEMAMEVIYNIEMDRSPEGEKRNWNNGHLLEVA